MSNVVWLLLEVCILILSLCPIASFSICVGGKADCSYDLQIPDSKKQFNSSVGIPVRTIITCLGTPCACETAMQSRQIGKCGPV